MREPAIPDYYQLLGIKDVEASQKTVHKAFKAASLRTHPDKGGSVEAMQQVNDAYEKLSYICFRDEYDAGYAKLKDQWKKYRWWVVKTNNALPPKSKISKATSSKAKKTKTKASKNKKSKPKKVKAKPEVVKRETEAEDIGPQFKAVCNGVEMTIEEHEKRCGCTLFQRYKTNPEVEYTYEEGDDDYMPED